MFELHFGVDFIAAVLGNIKVGTHEVVRVMLNAIQLYLAGIRKDVCPIENSGGMLASLYIYESKLHSQVT